jgi:hypothetical protein
MKEEKGTKEEKGKEEKGTGCFLIERPTADIFEVPNRSDHAMSMCCHRFSANGDCFRPYRNIFVRKITALSFRSFEPTHDF